MVISINGPTVTKDRQFDLNRQINNGLPVSCIRNCLVLYSSAEEKIVSSHGPDLWTGSAFNVLLLPKRASRDQNIVKFRSASKGKPAGILSTGTVYFLYELLLRMQ